MSFTYRHSPLISAIPPTTTMSVKECGHHSSQRRNLLRLILGATAAFVLLILLTIFLIWVILLLTLFFLDIVKEIRHALAFQSCCMT